MKTKDPGTPVRVLRVMAIIVVLMLATGRIAVAQERPPGLLNKLEVQALVARGDPVDHDRLFVHFKVLWDRYLTEAEQHEIATRNVMGNPNRISGAGLREHNTRLANLARNSAETLRKLALYHKHMAEGAPATLPAGASRFHSGAGAPDPTEQELAALRAKARTRTDHLALAEYLRTQALRYTRDANAHMMLALTYRGGRLAQAAVHQESLAHNAREAARRAKGSAALHQQFATLG